MHTCVKATRLFPAQKRRYRQPKKQKQYKKTNPTNHKKAEYQSPNTQKNNNNQERRTKNEEKQQQTSKQLKRKKKTTPPPPKQATPKKQPSSVRTCPSSVISCPVQPFYAPLKHLFWFSLLPLLNFTPPPPPKANQLSSSPQTTQPFFFFVHFETAHFFSSHTDLRLLSDIPLSLPLPHQPQVSIPCRPSRTPQSPPSRFFLRLPQAEYPRIGKRRTQRKGEQPYAPLWVCTTGTAPTCDHWSHTLLHSLPVLGLLSLFPLALSFVSLALARALSPPLINKVSPESCVCCSFLLSRR